MAYAARQALTEAAVRQPGTQSSNGHTDERDAGQIAGPATATAPPPLPCVRMPCQRSWAGLRGCDRRGAHGIVRLPLTGTAPIVLRLLLYFVKECYDCAGALICPGLEPGISGSGGRRLIH